MARDAFLSLLDWRERCQKVCDAHGYGGFNHLDATRRAEIVGIAKNVAGGVPSAGPANSHGAIASIENDKRTSDLNSR